MSTLSREAVCTQAALSIRLMQLRCSTLSGLMSRTPHSSFNVCSSMLACLFLSACTHASVQALRQCSTLGGVDPSVHTGGRPRASHALTLATTAAAPRDRVLWAQRCAESGELAAQDLQLSQAACPVIEGFEGPVAEVRLIRQILHCSIRIPAPTLPACACLQ